jgi:serine/threonine protein kinase/tetratricopeptide (TPR) repeat protein
MQPGTKLGPYEIVEPIGRGGMGEVYRAWDARLQRHVAIKTVASESATDPQFRERFEREARAVAALSHPNVLAIHDVGSHEGMPYVAVELLEGETLRSTIGVSPLPLTTVLDYAAQMGRGLAAAHDRGIVHRDLKPENIFVTRDGQIKLLDFGLATEPVRAAATEATRLPATERGMLLGTAGYMSPEQARGEPADARSDIFSLGCVLYEMLSGRRAFGGDSRIETLHAILKEHPPELESLRAGLPASLDRIVRRCLAKAPESRFQTARDLVFALETLTEGSEQRTPAPSPAPSPGAKRWMTAAILAGVAVAGAATYWWTVMRDRPQQQSERASAAVEDRRRVLAVLPFENISRAGEAYFAAGMTEEVTNQLSKLSGLRVISRTAIARFKDPRNQLSAMATELGIGSVVTGTVREDGTRVRVNVELIDAPSGQLVWSEQYDREGVDVFAAQSDIALRVGDVLNASVTLEERSRVGKRPTSSVAAYELYIRSRTAQSKTQEERLASRIELLRKAVALDPQFAEAYSEIANLHYFQGAYGDLSALSRGVEAANQALKIDPQLATAYRVLGLNLGQLGRFKEALSAYRRGAELGPSNAGVFADLSHGASMAGHFDEALAAGKRAAQLTGRLAGHYHVGVALMLLGDDARTERFLLTGATTRKPDMRTEVLLALLDLRRGHAPAAVDRIRAAVANAPENIEGLLTRAEVLTFAGAADAPEVVRSLMQRSPDGLTHNAPYPVKLLHAYQLHRAGSTQEAAKIFDAILDANRKSLLGGADWPMAFMQDAVIHALRGKAVTALDALDRAYEAGWRDGRTLAIDPMFTSLQSEPRFKQLVSRIEADVAAMRARADYSGLP